MKWLFPLFFQVFVNAAQRDAHQEREHSPQKSNSSSTLGGSSIDSTTSTSTLAASTTSVAAGTSSPMKPTISVSLATASNNPHRIIVVKSPTKSPTQAMTTTILKKVEVIQPQKCGKCHEFVSPGGHGYHHKCEQVWHCPYCEKTLKTISALRKHFREVHPSKGQVVICEACTLAFKDLRGLEAHNREKHSSIPSSPESFHGFATPTKELEMSRTMETVILNLNDLM